MLYLVTLIAGLLNAFAWAAYIKSVAAKQRYDAACYDFWLLILQYGMLQLWATHANDIYIISTWVMSNAVGTFLISGRARV